MAISYVWLTVTFDISYLIKFRCPGRSDEPAAFWVIGVAYYLVQGHKHSTLTMKEFMIYITRNINSLS